MPFATSNGDVSWLIDLDPAEGGTGQIVEEDLEFSRLHVVAASLDALFTQLLADLDDGKLCVYEWGNSHMSAGIDRVLTCTRQFPGGAIEYQPLMHNSSLSRTAKTPGQRA